MISGKEADVKPTLIGQYLLDMSSDLALADRLCALRCLGEYYAVRPFQGSENWLITLNRLIHV